MLASFLEEDPSGGGQGSAQLQSMEIQQLLTYALIHPALSLENKRSLAELIRQLDDDGTQEMALSLLESTSNHQVHHQGGLDMFPPLDPQQADVYHAGGLRSPCWDPWNSPSSGLGGPPPKQKQQQPQHPPPSGSQRIRRSNSLTPPSNTMAYQPDPWSKMVRSTQNVPTESFLTHFVSGPDTQVDAGRIKPRSLSLSSPSETANGLPHCPLSPQNSLASSGSGSGSDSIYSDDSHRPASFHVPGSGMRGKIERRNKIRPEAGIVKNNNSFRSTDVPSWLKGLRLHKYAHLFSLLTYEEMLALTEEQLELQGVTKGARHKIALSIQRLRDRPTLLAQLEKEVVDTGNLQGALGELKNILGTPIKPFRGAPGGERGSCSSAEDHNLYVASSLSPSPSLLTRDDTSGYSSLDGSMDNLAHPRAPSSAQRDSDSLNKLPPQPCPPSPLVPVHRTQSLTTADMPTVIVSAAPDTDSAEEGSDTSCDDGLGGIGESLSPTFRSAFASAELELLDASHLSQDDLPGLITRLLGKICTQLLVSAIPAEESVSQFVALLDRCLNHEAFSQRQRRRIASWKEQVHRIWSVLPAGGGGGNNGSNSGNNSRLTNGTGGGPGVAGQHAKNPGEPRSFARRWSNVAHYPGFYNAPESSAGSNSGGVAPFGGGSFQPSSYSLFPPRQQRGNSHPSPCPSPSQGRPPFAGPTHNSYGQHNHLSTGKEFPAISKPQC